MSDNITLHEQNNSINYYLNFTPCQNGKTQRSIDCIKKIIASQFNDDNIYERSTYQLTIIIVNNSLLETNQWKKRLKDNNIKIGILSSDKNADYKNLSKFTDKFWGEDINDLDNVLVICNNNRRDEDLDHITNNIIKSNKKLLCDKFNIDDIRLNIMYDEVDKPQNLSNATKFIRKTKDINFINSIHLITATPFNNFWSKLQKEEIKYLNTLKNLIHVDSIDKIINNYRKIDDHNLIFNDYNEKGIIYTKKIYEEYLIEKNNLIVFCPCSILQKYHDELKDYLLNKNSKNLIILINGNNKKIYYNDEIKEIEDFKIEYNLITNNNESCEVYTVLSKIKEIYEDSNIFLIGYYCVGRGVTLQTNTFNFTDMIVPPINNVPEAVQILGRANGSKEFVNIHNIYINKKYYDIYSKYISKCINILKSNNEILKADDFISDDRIYNYKIIEDSNLKKLLNQLSDEQILKIKKNDSIRNVLNKKISLLKFYKVNTRGKNEGFITDSIRVKNKKTGNTIQSYNDLKEQLNKCTNGQNRFYTIYPTYKNKSDPTTLTFLIKIPN